MHLSALAVIVPSKPDVRGVLDLDLRLHGRLNRPMMDGRLVLENVEYAGQGIKVDSLNCMLECADYNVTIERFAAKVNRGRCDLKGFIDIADGYLDTMLIDIT